MELLPYISGFSNSLPIFLLSGVVHIPSPNKHFQRISQNWIIYIITDGIMKIMENGNQYTLTAGDIMIFSPGKCHYGLLTNEHIDYYYIHFDWNCLQDITMTSEEYLQQKVGGHSFFPTPSSTVQNTFLLPKYFHPTRSDFEKIIRQMQHLTNFNSTNGLHQQSINDALLFVLLLQMSRSELSHILHTEQENLSLPFRICDYLKNNYSHKKVVVPGKTLQEVSKILPGSAEDEVSIFLTDNHIVFEFENTTVVSRLIEGEYFKIEQMLSSDYETKVKINKRELLDCIDRATLLVKEGDKKPIIMNIQDTSMELKINSAIGSMIEEIDIEKEGKDILIGFNPKFFIDALRVIDNDEVTLYMVNPKAPCYIKDEEESFIYLILPVNFNAATV